jgi:hypothetical protein
VATSTEVATASTEVAAASTEVATASTEVAPQDRGRRHPSISCSSFTSRSRWALM